MDNYHILELIGEGSFGKVYKGRRKYTGQIVALKFIPKVGRSETELKGLRKEIEIMRTLHHVNIVECLDSFETDNEVVAVTDYAEGELFQILEDDGSLPEEQVQSIACQLVSALFYLHAHRILHRDMKPQNILLGKGAVVKLCDFGFARAMSMNTLVLTSIKGTPLYMSPELVQEKPYDHTADLWALGCILYELNVGKPPFCTNSIFQLVSLIVKDPVRWPKSMNTVFKDFLQGLLTKNPQQRLSWPQLLYHPFVQDGVIVSEEDASLDSPFTIAPSRSLIIKKEKQVQQKMPPPGHAKLLIKAMKKTEKKAAKAAKEKKVEAWVNKAPGTQEPIPTHPARPHTQEWEKEVPKTAEPTPRVDRISRDYKKEYPSVEVEPRITLHKSPDIKKNMENVNIESEGEDSDDEWQDMMEQTDPGQGHDPEVNIKLIKSKTFRQRLLSRLKTSASQVRDGMLDGAANLRPVLQIITNLVTLKCELEDIISFVNGTELPKQQLLLLADILDKDNVQQQPWCQQILLDLTVSIHAYFACEIAKDYNKDKSSIELYVEHSLMFAQILPMLLLHPVDGDMKLRQQSLYCLIHLCEVFEQQDESCGDKFFIGLATEHCRSLDSLVACLEPEESVLQKLTDIAEGNTELAANRMEELIDMTVATVAALTHLPLELKTDFDGKRQIAMYLGSVFCDRRVEHISNSYFNFVRLPQACANVLKSMYSMCQVCAPLCVYLASNDSHLESLLGILQGMVEVADMELNTILEITLHTLSSIVLQINSVPLKLIELSPLFVAIFNESQIASHTAASALLFSQFVVHHVPIETQYEDLLMSALSVFTDLSQVCVKCPFDYGVLDGLLLLLCQLISNGEVPMAGLYIETGIWNAMWHRLAQSLQIGPDTQSDTLADIDIDTWPLPDWSLISPQGLMAALQITVAIFTKETFSSVMSFTDSENIVTVSLAHMLSPHFCYHLSKSGQVEGEGKVGDLILQLVQIFCFPFAIDIGEDMQQKVYRCYLEIGVLPRLLLTSAKYLPLDRLEMPMALISRLIVGNEDYSEQLNQVLAKTKEPVVEMLSSALSNKAPVSVETDCITLCTHLARISPHYIDLVLQILQGDKEPFEPLIHILAHPSSTVRSRSCGMMGNLMKHSNDFYQVLGDRPSVMKHLLQCLIDEDPQVRKSSSFAIGNASYHSDELYRQLKPCIPDLIKLLSDPVAKARANASSALGNMALHSEELCSELIKQKTLESLLEVACHDNQYIVQEGSLAALRSMCLQQKLKDHLKKISAPKRLKTLVDSKAGHPFISTMRPDTGHPFISTMKPDTGHTPISTMRPDTGHTPTPTISHKSKNITTVMAHCNKLMKLLNS